MPWYQDSSQASKANQPSGFQVQIIIVLQSPKKASCQSVEAVFMESQALKICKKLTLTSSKLCQVFRRRRFDKQHVETITLSVYWKKAQYINLVVLCSRTRKIRFRDFKTPTSQLHLTCLNLFRVFMVETLYRSAVVIFTRLPQMLMVTSTLGEEEHPPIIRVNVDMVIITSWNNQRKSDTLLLKEQSRQLAEDSIHLLSHQKMSSLHLVAAAMENVDTESFWTQTSQGQSNFLQIKSRISPILMRQMSSKTMNTFLICISKNHL